MRPFSFNKNRTVSSLYITGSNYVDINSSLNVLSSTTMGTISCWVKFNQYIPNTNNHLIAFGDTNGVEYLRLFQRNTFGTIRVDLYQGGSTKWGSETNLAISSSQWYHIAITQDGAGGTNNTLYINGTEPSMTYSGTNKGNWFSVLTNVDNGRVGCININNLGNVANLDGNVTDVSFFNRDLSSSEIIDMYNNGVPKDESGREGLIAYYRPGQGQGDNWNIDNTNEWTFIDQSINNNSGFTSGAAFLDIQNDAPG